MKRYNEYKDSGVEWIGEIPSNWHIIDFRRCVSLKQGLQIAQDKRFETDGKNRYVYITVKYTNSNKEDVDTEYIEKPYKSVICDKDDVLLARTGATGKVITDVEGVFHNNFFKIIYDKQQITKEYLVYYLKQETIQNYLKLIAGTTTIPDLNHGAFLSTKVILPSILEQNKICNYLDKKTLQMEKLISKKEGLIETLKASRTKLISETVTKGLDKDAPMKDSGVKWIGEIPEHWEVKRLKYIADIIMGQSPDSNDYNFEELGHPFLQGNAEFTERSPMPKVYCQKAKKYSRIGDILMSVRAPVGAINISNQVYGIGRGLCSINCLKINQEYMWHAIPIFINELKINSKGTTYESVTMDDVNNMICIVPPLNEQKKISRYLDGKVIQIDEIILKTEEQIDILKKAKQKLITEVVTGKIDVTNL